MKQKQNSICYASCIHCVTERIYCRRSWNFENSTNVGRQDIWPCHAKKWNDNSSSKEIKHRNNCQRLKQQMEVRDRDRDIFSLWSTHGKTVHVNEHSDSVWFSDDSWVTAGDLHVKVAKKAFRSISCHILKSLLSHHWGRHLHFLSSPASLFEVTNLPSSMCHIMHFDLAHLSVKNIILIFSVKVSHKRSCIFN